MTIPADALSKRAPNSRWVDGVTFKGRLYPGPYAIHAAADVQTFSLRLLIRSALLDDDVIVECLYMPSTEYRARHSTRKTWVLIEGQKMSVDDLFETTPKPSVTYPKFRQRLKRLEKAGRLSTASIDFAGAATEEA